jgi:WD40 repeat protein
MDRSSWLILVLAAVCAPSLCAPQQPTEYEAFTKTYRASPLRAWFPDHRSDNIKLTIAAIEGDENAAPLGPGDLGYRVRYGCSVSSDGQVSCFSVDGLGSKGYGLFAMPDSGLKALDQVLADLPDDFSVLPPPNRRLVLQTPQAGHTLVRVYDRANAPESILTILRLIQPTIKPWVLTFKPDGQWTAPYYRPFGAIAISPDGKQVISDAGSGPLQFWDPNSHGKLNEIARLPISSETSQTARAASLTISPDGSVAAVTGGEIDILETQTWNGFRRIVEPGQPARYSFLNSHFTPDGNYLMAQTNEPALRIFDTKTWQRSQPIPGMPVGAIDYYPAASGQRAVYAAANGSVALWDSTYHHDVVSLDESGSILRLAYSPDESMVAAAILHRPGAADSSPTYRLRIWRTDDGALLHDLWPVELEARAATGLLWWPDGKYLLAVSNAENARVGIWSIGNGRQRAELGGRCRALGIVLLEESRIVEGCREGIIQIWDMPKILEQIDSFEASFSGAK